MLKAKQKNIQNLEKLIEERVYCTSIDREKKASEDVTVF
jgi:hypothetical protein